MRMRTLGGTGIKVSSYCLGAMMFGAWGNPDHEESIRIIHAALDGGINFVDTADVYSAGESEEIVGQALLGRRDDVVLATKAHSAMGKDVNMRGNSRRWIVREVENSLRRLQKDGMGVIAWSPLAGGWLTGRYRQGTDVDMSVGRARRIPQRFDPSLPGNAAKLAAVEELIKISADAGCSLTHLALAFVAGHPAVTSAIIGPRTMDQLTDLLAGADVVLDDDILDRIDQIVPPGVTLNAADAGWQPPSLADPAARRRPLTARAAG